MSSHFDPYYGRQEESPCSPASPDTPPQQRQNTADSPFTPAEPPAPPPAAVVAAAAVASSDSATVVPPSNNNNGSWTRNGSGKHVRMASPVVDAEDTAASRTASGRKRPPPLDLNSHSGSIRSAISPPKPARGLSSPPIEIVTKQRDQSPKEEQKQWEMKNSESNGSIASLQASPVQQKDASAVAAPAAAAAASSSPSSSPFRSSSNNGNGNDKTSNNKDAPGPRLSPANLGAAAAASAPPPPPGQDDNDTAPPSRSGSDAAFAPAAAAAATAGAAAAAAAAKGTGNSPPPPPPPADDDPVEKFHSAPNPRHAIPWNQRLPGDRSMMTSFSQSCGFMLSPKFWMRVETALRNALLAWLATSLILPNEAWRSKFEHPFQFAIGPILVNGTRFGHFTAGVVSVFKALFISILFAIVITWSDASELGLPPAAATATTAAPAGMNATANMSMWVTVAANSTSAAAAAAPPAEAESRVGKWVGFWIYYFCALIVIAIFTYQSDISRTAPYFFSQFALLLWFFPEQLEDGVHFYTGFVRDTFVAVGFAFLPGILPFPRFALHRAQELLAPASNSISIIVQGVCASAWTNNTVEQRLDLVRLRQMRAHIRETDGKIAAQLDTAWWEPFGGLTLARARARAGLLSRLGTLLSSFVRLVDQIVTDRPDVADEDSTFSKFGRMLKPELSKTLDIFDYTLLRLSDCENLITDEEMHSFRVSAERFAAALLDARTQMYYGEAVNTYKLSTIDLYAAHFFFFLESVFDAVKNYKEPKEEEVQSRLCDVWDAMVGKATEVWDIIWNRMPSITSNDWAIGATKNAIKLSVTMTAAAALNYVFESKNIVPPSILALMHFSESTFSWSQQHVQGLIYGSVFGFIALGLTGGNYAAIVCLFEVLFFVAEFIKTSDNWLSAGIAGAINVASMLFSKTETALVKELVILIAAMTLHLLITTVLLWPNNPILALRSEIDSSISTFRDGVATLLVSLRPSHIDPEVSQALFADFKAKLGRSLGTQRILIPAAAAEPTLVGTPFPLPLFQRVLLVLERMDDLFTNISTAFCTLQGSNVDARDKNKNLHWMMIKIVCPPCKKLAEHISQLTDLLLMLLREGSASVPTTQLVVLSQDVVKMAIEIGHLRNAKVNKIRARKYERVQKIRAKRKLIAELKKQSAGGGAEESDEELEEVESDSDEDIRDMLDSSDEDEEMYMLEDQELQRLFTDDATLGSPSDEVVKARMELTSALISGTRKDSGHLTPHARRNSGAGYFDHRKPTKKKVDPLLGADVDSVSVHATSSVMVSLVGIGRLYSELLEALLDILNLEEIGRMSG